MRERLSLLSSVDPYVGRYYSMEWVQQNVLRMTDDEIKLLKKQIKKETDEGLILDPQQIAMQAQQDMALGGDGGGAGGGAKPAAPKAKNESVSGDYSPSMKMITRVL